MAREGGQWGWFRGRARPRDAARIAAGSLARGLLEQQRLPEAEDAYRELLRRQPDNPAGLAGLGWVAMQRGEWQQALDIWNRCLGRFESREQLAWHIARCRALVQLGMVEEAEAACLSAAKKWPDDIQPIEQLVAFANMRGDHTKAVDWLDRLIAMKPDALPARVRRARILAAAGCLEECRTLVEDVLAGGAQGDSFSEELLEHVFDAVQFCCGGDRRVALLTQLGERARSRAESSVSVAAVILHAKVRLSLEDYDEARRIVRELVARGVKGEAVEGMTRVCDRYFAPGFPDASAAKVFCIGLSKTGTTSLDQALKMLGLQTLHWANPYTKSTISERDLFLFDGFSDIGISWQFEMLYATFPNARFIYTTRPIESWVKSMTSHYKRVHGVLEAKQLRQPALQQRFNGAAGLAEMNLYGRHDTWEESYRDFDRRVRQFFADKPADKLLELAICEGEGWEKLCPFLNVAVPAAPFPVKNAAP
jgi:tetratricopeptide (TPR) repeat protein